MQKADVTIYDTQEALEAARAAQAAKSTYTERFYTLMKLIKVSSMINKAKIISNPVMRDERGLF